MSRRKPLAAVAAVAALAVAAVAPNASAATTPTVDPTVCQLLAPNQGPFGTSFGPTMVPGGASLANVLATAGASVGCAAPAATSPQTMSPAGG